MGETELVLARKKDSRICFVRTMAESEEVDRQDLMAARGDSEDWRVEVERASRTREETKAKASSHRGVKSTEVVCSNLLQIADRIFVARVEISSVERKGEKEVVRESRIEGLNFSLKANSR